MKNMYWAYKNGGAYRNDKKIFVMANTSLNNTYLNTGASGRHVGFSNLPLIKTLLEKKCEVTRYPSFIYGGIQVANGKYIGSVFYGKSGHDVCQVPLF